MSNIRSNESETSGDDELLPEYDLDYSKARPNRFSGVVQSGSRVVVLEPDVAEVFTTQEQANAVLRALIATMPVQ
jgi:hypothetical protein